MGVQHLRERRETAVPARPDFDFEIKPKSGDFGLRFIKPLKGLYASIQMHIEDIAPRLKVSFSVT
jgi:hypothetical protein